MSDQTSTSLAAALAAISARLDALAASPATAPAVVEPGFVREARRTTKAAPKTATPDDLASWTVIDGGAFKGHPMVKFTAPGRMPWALSATKLRRILAHVAEIRAIVG